MQKVTQFRTQKPSRSRTGSTAHFRMWMADLQMKSALQKTNLAKLAKVQKEPKLETGYAIASTKYKSLWDLMQADRSAILSLKGMGPAKLTALHADLVAHNIKPKWEA